MHGALKDDGSRRKALVPGCGKGYDVALLASWGYDAYGLEVSAHAAEAANTYLAEPGEGPLEGEYKVKDEKVGSGAVKCLLGDFFEDGWIKEAGGEAGFDVIYDNTVCSWRLSRGVV
jgi:SAM-dependent methyltransferase